MLGSGLLMSGLWGSGLLGPRARDTGLPGSRMLGPRMLLGHRMLGHGRPPRRSLQGNSLLVFVPGFVPGCSLFFRMRAPLLTKSRPDSRQSQAITLATLLGCEWEVQLVATSQRV